MSEYFGDESPWARPIADTGFNSFDTPADVVSPWGDPLENASTRDEEEDSDSHPQEDALDPYGSFTESRSAAFVAHNEGEEDEDSNSDQPEQQQHEAAAAAAATTTKPEDPVPKLKNVNRNNHKKKRTGAIKVETVASDPLAASAAQFDNVALDSSVANLSISSDTDYNQPGAGTAASTASIWAPSSESANTSTRAISSKGSQRSQFEINVGDAAKVGDFTSAHTEYTIQMTTALESWTVKEAVVQRRYRDFRWLYRTLEHNHPGVIVPPPPEKQPLSRFSDEVIQQRRAALEQMLRKVTAHPLLCDDEDLQAFLTSGDFNEYLNSRLLADEELERATRGALNDASGSRDDRVGTQGGGGSGSGGAVGFIGSLSGALSLSRGTEMDPWTLEKKAHLDHVETQLREVCRELVALSNHRQQLSDALGDFANVMRVMGDIEATRRLSTVLRAFAKVHDRLSQIYLRQRQQNMLTLEATLDEHLRTVGSVRDALGSRQKVFSAAESAASELEKRQLTLDKLIRQGKTQEDRQKALEEEIDELSQTTARLHQQAADIAHLVESELARVSEEKVEEFRNSVEIYLENTVEAQKESIEIWETFYSQNFASA